MALRFPNHPYYIPIIKWQSWEQRALLQTRGDVKCCGSMILDTPIGR